MADRGADINARNNEGNTPLHEAAIKGFHKAVAGLLHAGADVSLKNNEGKNPFEYVSNNEGFQLREIGLDAAAAAGVYGNHDKVFEILEDEMSSHEK